MGVADKTLTSDERSVYQSLVARGVRPEDAMQDALDGVTMDEARKFSSGVPAFGRKTTGMLARKKWQINTIAALELVFQERCAQMEKHGEAMRHLPDGTGPDVKWIPQLLENAQELQESFRVDYDTRRAAPEGDYGQLTRMHLVREELAEAFELDGDDPEFLAEICQVAALCVQWMEYKLEERNV